MIIRPIEERKKEIRIGSPKEIPWFFIGLLSIGISVSAFGLIKSMRRK